jgi:hypothetical protein
VVTLGANERSEIIVGGPSGVLEIEMQHQPPYPWLVRDGVAMPLVALGYPPNWTSAPRDVRPWGMSIDIEPGQYAICSDAVMTRCASRYLAAGAIERVNGGDLLQ